MWRQRGIRFAQIALLERTTARELVEQVTESLDRLAVTGLDEAIDSFSDPVGANERDIARRQFLDAALATAVAAGGLAIGAAGAGDVWAGIGETDAATVISRRRC